MHKHTLTHILGDWPRSLTSSCVDELSNITESRQRMKTFPEQRKGLIKKSLLVTLCLFRPTTKRPPAPAGLSELSPSFNSFQVGQKNKDTKRGAIFWSGWDINDESEKRKVAEHWGDEDREGSTNRGLDWKAKGQRVSIGHFFYIFGLHNKTENYKTVCKEHAITRFTCSVVLFSAVFVCPNSLAAMQRYETDVCVGHYCNRSIYFIYPGRNGWSAPSGRVRTHTQTHIHGKPFFVYPANNRREALKLSLRVCHLCHCLTFSFPMVTFFFPMSILAFFIHSGSPEPSCV